MLRFLPALLMSRSSGISMKRLLVAAWLSLVLASTARAGWEEGLAAFERDDYATAFREWLPLAKQGHVRAQALLGFLYFQGHGVLQDYGEAVKWYYRAAEQGSDFAQYSLGFIYDEGRGVPQDFAEALKWYRRAAAQGYPDAQIGLGRMYEDGRGAPQDSGEAVKWFRRAAQQGNANAQVFLGLMYEGGRGVPQDYFQAYHWYNVAASRLPSGEKRDIAAEWRDSIGERMTSEQLALAQEMARNWRPKPEKPAPLDFSELSPVPDTPPQGSQSFGEGDPEAFPYRPAPPRASQSDIIEVQSALASLGYDPGPADGVLGSKTRAAIRAYQAAVGLPVDGEVSDVLLASLRTALVHTGTTAPRSAEKGPELYATGTGFVVSRAGHVLTNQHVVTDCELVRTGRGGAAGKTAAVGAVDSDNDLALLLRSEPMFGQYGEPVEVDSPLDTEAVATFRRGRGVRPGDTVVAVGFPLQGLLASSANVTTGTVSALAGIRDDIRYLQITAPIQPGNSGGPLLDMSGNVVGVVVAKLDALMVAEAIGDIPQNVNFAIKDSVARSFLDARGIEYETAPSERELSAAEVGERAAAFTVLVECWK
jgi:TPR repeat protein/S1-C subfamily serine protease